MLTQQQLCRARDGFGLGSVVFAATLLLSPATLLLSPSNALAQDARAQDDRQPNFLVDVAKHVILDPTTYAPALLGYDATRRDWKSSQPFFQIGFVEHNPRFTASGRANDLAVSYGEGNRRILSDAFANLEMSIMNNATDSLLEHVLAEKHPSHRKLIRALGWIEKSAFASYMSYRLSAGHYRQWQQNQQMAGRLGIK